MASTVKDAVIFCAEEPVRRMLRALCARRPGRIVVADAEDDTLCAKAAAYARENDIPLLLFARQPQTVREPAGVTVRFLARPFLFSDFCAAVDALCGTGAPPASAAESVPDEKPAPLTLSWDAVRRTVRCGDAAVTLTEREAGVFAALYEASPAAVARETLLTGFDRTAGNGAEVYVTYLRRKLAKLPLTVTIASRRGEGYVLLIPGAADKL